MSIRMLAVVLLAAALTAGASVAVAEDEIAVQASKVSAANEKAVVQIEATLTVHAEGPDAPPGEQEQKMQVQGVVVGPNGMVVASYISLNPASAVGKIRLPGGRGTVAIKGELSDVKICLSDGTEIPARLVLKDEDLDLAFIAPKDKLDKADADEIAAVDLAKGAPKAARLDQVVRLGRLGKDLGRELQVELDRVTSIITRPRLMYVLGGAQPGSPVFTPSGELLGIIVFHKKPGGGETLGRTTGAGGVPVVLPAKDVLKIAEQAREELKKAPAETKASEEKPAEEKPAETKPAE